MAKGKRKPEKVKAIEVFGYLKIPAKVLSMQNINALEKIILTDIAYLGAKNGYRVGNIDMAKKYGAKRRTVVNALKRLKDLGYIANVGPNIYNRCLEISGANIALFEKPHKDKDKANIALPEPSTSSQEKPTNTYPESSEPLRLARLLLSEIQQHKPDFKEPNIQAWARPLDLMIRLDNRKPERIAKVIRWCQADNGNGSWCGWQDVILSTGKLRAKFDELESRMDKDNESSKTSTTAPKYDESYVR